MENGDQRSDISEDGRKDGPNVVVLLFSKSQRTRSDWHALTKTLFEAINGVGEVSTGSLLDKATSESEGANNRELDDLGRVYEIRARTQTRAGAENVSLDDCRDLRELHSVRQFESKEGVEAIFQPIELYLTHKTPGLAVFDMDSTLIQQEVIDELARSVGRYEQVAAVTEAAMRGELDFEESLRARVAQLKGVSTGIWEHLRENVITFTPGAHELVLALKHLGWKTAVLSGGFTPLAYWVKDTLGLDYAYANQLGMNSAGSELIGEVLANTPIVGAALKRDLLLKLAAESDISISHTIAVGDGSNDLLMMNAAGFGIAFNAKPKVQAAAPARLNSTTLLDIMYVLGFTKKEVTDILATSSAD